MASNLSTARTKDQLLVARHHLEPAGVYDHSGRELTNAHVMLHYRDLLGDGIMKLAKHAHKHANDPDHEYHQDLAAAVHGRMEGRWRNDRFDAPIEWYAAQEMGVKEADITNFYTLPEAIRVAADRRMKLDKRANTDEWTDNNSDFLNLFLTGGITALWQIGEGNASGANSGGSAAGVYATYNNAQARIGVGDSSTAASAGQTDLQAGTNHTYIGMDATYPTQSLAQTIFRSTMGSAIANFSWNEFVVDNANASNSTSTTRSGGSTLDRVQSAQGSKAGGQTWQPSMTLSLS